MAVRAASVSPSATAATPFSMRAILAPLIAIIIGVYLLRGVNWARWGAVLWMAFHVGVGALNSLQQVIVHAVLLAVFAYFLFRPGSNLYFGKSVRAEQQ